jgi:hypothetical protein
MNLTQACRSPLVLQARKSYISFSLLIFLSLFFAIPQPSYSQERIVPEDTWVRLYFGTIDELTVRLGLKPLRSTEIQSGDLEMRIWSGFGLTGQRGFILRKSGDKWTSFSLSDPQGTHIINGRPVEASIKKGPKRTDWPQKWERLIQSGILEIKDDSQIPHCSVVLDGIGYVVEIAKADYYRTYLVDNPDSQRSEDGDKFLHLLPILYEAFGEKSPFDLATLPAGEVRTVATISVDYTAHASTLGWKLNGPEYQVGDIPAEDSVTRLEPKEVLAQGLSLFAPQCHELPRPFTHFTGEIVVELFVQADGTVSAAKALYGPPMLAKDLIKMVLKWKFIPLVINSKIRCAVLSIRFDQKWVDFPWLK